jgi:hypothetical protein
MSYVIHSELLLFAGLAHVPQRDRQAVCYNASRLEIKAAKIVPIQEHALPNGYQFLS